MSRTARQTMFIERIISAATYLTVGIIGFLWLLFWGILNLLNITKKSYLTSFLKYHILQSIFIALAYTLICNILTFIQNILSLIPFVNVLVAQISLFFNAPYIFGYSIIQAGIYALLLYLAGGAILGKYSRIPWVSDVIMYYVK